LHPWARQWAASDALAELSSPARDQRRSSPAQTRELGISEVAADLLPDDKRERVKALVDAGRVVAMVGDGINDAPALIEAQVGVAMGSGTDVARESADVVLLGNDLLKFADTLSIAHRARRIIWANFAGTIGVDALGSGSPPAACSIRCSQRSFTWHPSSRSF
jgi:cation transport ATPase